MKVSKVQGKLELKNSGGLSLFFIGAGSAFSKVNFQNNVLFIKGGISDIYSALKGADTFEDFVRVIDGYCRFILMDAEEEGVIKQVEDMDYATYVLKSSVVSFIFSTNAVKRSFETVCGNTMQALLKALN